MKHLNVWYLGSRRSEVIDQAHRKRLAFLVEHDLLEKGRADTLSYATMNLPIDDHRIDNPPAIFGNDVTFDTNLIGIWIDLDDGQMCSRGARSEDWIISLGRSQFLPLISGDAAHFR